MRDIDCLRCGTKMNYVSDEKFQLGQTGWLLGDLPNLVAGAMRLSIYGCPNCGKIEFFTSEDDPSSGYSNGIEQKQCPKCGKVHDMDYYKCPFCKYDYLER